MKEFTYQKIVSRRDIASSKFDVLKAAIDSAAKEAGSNVGLAMLDKGPVVAEFVKLFEPIRIGDEKFMKVTVKATVYDAPESGEAQ